MAVVPDPLYDVIVVGAGIQGSATAYFLAKSGKRTLLIEQFPLPHNRGSSHGHSRITRMAYGAMDHYTKMMPEAFSIIRDLERETGKQLFINNGFLTVGKESSPFVKGTIESLRANKLPHTVMTYEEGMKKYPYFSVPREVVFIYDDTGGILLADKVLAAFQEQFVRHGGVIRDCEKVTDVQPGATVHVKTTRGQYRSTSLVLTPGPWAKPLLKDIGINLPVKTHRMLVFYWKQKQASADMSAESCPTLYVQTGDREDDWLYGIPAYEYPGHVKVCPGYGPQIDPDVRDTGDATYVVDEMKAKVKNWFPTLEPTPSVVETCIYMRTADTDIVLDRHPRWRNIVVAAGFSGHGFKLAPVVGKLLSEIVSNRPTSYDVTPFVISRL